ncbi:hypothetical protein K1719_013358 [Acacia pycnantha]|nr:hypothetical protein K1719_013358 [Acacia pycnantha]
MASSSFSNPFLSPFLSLVCFFFFIESKTFVSAITRKEYSELQHITHHYHHVPLSSFFPSSTCTSPPQGGSRKGWLEVVHKHGPCSKPKRHTSSSSSSSSSSIIPHSEILEQDIARVRAIQWKLWEAQRQASEQDRKSTTTTSEASLDKAAAPAPAEVPLPAESGEIIGSGDYFVKLGLGTPAREFSLIFDTGSDLTWTQCLPCLRSDSCYTQNEPIFDPSKSSSYSNIPCSSSQCSQLFSATGNNPECSSPSGDCMYSISYGDKSLSAGNYAKETLTITPAHVVSDFLFGCGHDNEGLFNDTDGILGLGRNQISFVQQTSDIFYNIFSYCLPATATDVGYLNLGGEPASDNVIYTPFSSVPPSSSFYALDLIGISLSGDSLSITSSEFSSGVIIDSGTVITRLPQAVYGPLRDAFRKAMSKYRMAGPVSILDTCYDLRGCDTVIVPKVTLSFGGGANVDLDASGVVYALSETLVCFAFAANEDPTSPTIIGNTQQRTLEVVYDVDGGKIGFRPHSCRGSSNSAIDMVEGVCSYRSGGVVARQGVGLAGPDGGGVVARRRRCCCQTAADGKAAVSGGVLIICI